MLSAERKRSVRKNPDGNFMFDRVCMILTCRVYIAPRDYSRDLVSLPRDQLAPSPHLASPSFPARRPPQRRPPRISRPVATPTTPHAPHTCCPQHQVFDAIDADVAALFEPYSRLRRWPPPLIMTPPSRIPRAPFHPRRHQGLSRRRISRTSRPTWP